MNKQEVLKCIKNRLIVSCQARVGWAMYGSDIMAAFAKAAEEGGACGIRATGADNIKAIKERVNLPIIGINKCFSNEFDVYITPTYESAKEILDCGIEIIALDATCRKRPNGEKIDEIVKKIKTNYPEVLIMGEISTVEEAKNILNLGFDLISTTLSGYTEESKDIKSVNLELIRQIKKITDLPIIAEGKIKTELEARQTLEAGAYSVVVGTAITRPEIITQRYVEELSKFQQSH
ncbi:N-acetylmannosamine-6-phosphate 2-epimerase [Anaerorhabdus sp.]|uniref:N-acetylmannosamine-6-phosphate 2-epimerase n=1 Tax=Anaerorhabdus sp. TaxID=1872524 RepID=UPI002FCA4FA1